MPNNLSIDPKEIFSTSSNTLSLAQASQAVDVLQKLFAVFIGVYLALYLLFATLSLILFLLKKNLEKKIQKITEAENKEWQEKAASKMSQVLFSAPEKLNANYEKWNKIEKLMQDNNPDSWRLALIEADRLFAKLLNDLGFEKQTVAEALKDAKTNDLPNKEELWFAHKLRNKAVHEDVALDKNEVLRALHAYKTALRHFDFLK